MVAILQPRTIELRPRLIGSARLPAHIYARRRLAVLAVVALAVVVLCTAAAALRPDGTAAVTTLTPGRPAPAAGADAGDTPARAYVVQPGDTVWTIATSLEPDGDVRAVVDDLVEANGGRAELIAGQRLVLPPA